MPTRKTPYVSTNLTVPARDALQRLTLNESARVGQRISMSATLLAVLTVADRHADELAEVLAEATGKDVRP